MKYTPSERAVTRSAKYPKAFDRMVEKYQGDTRTVFCAAGWNTPAWQDIVYEVYGEYPVY